MNCLFENISEAEWAEWSDWDYGWQNSVQPVSNDELDTLSESSISSFNSEKTVLLRTNNEPLQKGRKPRRPVYLMEPRYWETTNIHDWDTESSIKRKNNRILDMENRKKIKKDSQKNKKHDILLLSYACILLVVANIGALMYNCL